MSYLREPVTDGTVKTYPVWWLAVMSKDSRAFQQIETLRSLHGLMLDVLGKEWIAATLDSESAVEREKLAELTQRWEDDYTVEQLKDFPNEVDLVTTSDYIRIQLTSFDPMWVKYQKVFKNTRPEYAKEAAQEEKADILRDLDEFDEALKQPVAKRARV